MNGRTDERTARRHSHVDFLNLIVDFLVLADVSWYSRLCFFSLLTFYLYLLSMVVDHEA